METTKVEIGSVHGRFQPFHKDHLKYLLAAKNQCQHIIVGITSYNIRALSKTDLAPHRSIPLNNPMTYFERVQMIRSALLDAGCRIEDFSFSPFPIEKPEILPDFIPLSIPCFTTDCENWNKEKVRMLENQGYKVVVLYHNREKPFSGTTIRKLIIANDESWKQMVPLATVYAIEQFGIQERLRIVARETSNQ